MACHVGDGVKGRGEESLALSLGTVEADDDGTVQVGGERSPWRAYDIRLGARKAAPLLSTMVSTECGMADLPR